MSSNCSRPNKALAALVKGARAQRPLQLLTWIAWPTSLTLPGAKQSVLLIQSNNWPGRPERLPCGALFTSELAQQARYHLLGQEQHLLPIRLTNIKLTQEARSAWLARQDKLARCWLAGWLAGWEKQRPTSDLTIAGRSLVATECSCRRPCGST